MRWILQKLLGLDPSVLKPEAALTPRLAQDWPLWIMLLILVSIAVYSAVIYRKEGRTVSPGMRSFMAALRIAALTLLVLLLCEPILSVSEEELTKPYVVFMIDTSQSMNLHDRFPEDEDVERARRSLPEKYTFEGFSRPDLKREHLQKLSRIDFINSMLVGEDTDPRRTSLERRYHLRFYEFAKDIRPTYSGTEAAGGPSDPVDAGRSEALGTETRLGDCMRKVLAEMRGQTVAALVLLTDGRSNAGDNPVEVARLAGKRGVPVFTVGIGDRNIFDVEVRRVEAPERARAGDDVSFVATVVQKGYADRDVKVMLRRGAERVADKTVRFPADGKPFTVELQHRPELPGKVDYTVEVEALPGELVSDNNSRTHSLNVVEGKTKVLYVEGQDLPRWEYRHLKIAMMRDRTLQVSTLLAERAGEFFYDGNYQVAAYPSTDKEFLNYDVIILGDVNPEIFSRQQLELTKQFVDKHGGGFMMIAGERYAPMSYVEKDNPIAPLIPVVVDPADEAMLEMGRTITAAFKPEVTQAGWQSPILRLENDERVNREIWSKPPEEGGLAPIFWYLPVPKAKPTTTVLVRHPTAKARGEQQNRPLLVVGRIGKGLTMFQATDEFWRWRFSHGDRYFYRYYAQAIQYLASARGGQTKTSVLSADSPTYSLGEAVKLTAEVQVLKGEKYEPLKQDSVAVHYLIEGLGEQIPVELKAVPGQEGVFEGRLLPKGRGKYHAWLKSFDAEKAKGGECDFEVKLPQLEYENPRMDEETLKGIAESGGRDGAFIHADRFRDLPALIKEPERKKDVTTEHPLWDNWRLFALFSAVIVVEWVLRKRVRMM